MVVIFVVVVVVQWLVVVVVVVMVGVLALVVDFREVMMTSPPELAHCAPPKHTHTHTNTLTPTQYKGSLVPVTQSPKQQGDVRGS